MTLIRRVATAGALAVLGAVGLAGCSDGELGSTQITESDAYRIGCPAIDSALATGSVANKAGLATLKGLRDHRGLNSEATGWVDAGIDLLRSADPKEAPKEARTLIVDGCKEHGHTLQNLKK